MIHLLKTGLLIVLFSAASESTAGSREDEIIMMKVEAHASLDSRRNIKEWCEKKYPETALLAKKVDLYL